MTSVDPPTIMASVPRQRLFDYAPGLGWLLLGRIDQVMCRVPFLNLFLSSSSTVITTNL